MNIPSNPDAYNEVINLSRELDLINSRHEERYSDDPDSSATHRAKTSAALVLLNLKDAIDELLNTQKPQYIPPLDIKPTGLDEGTRTTKRPM